MAQIILLLAFGCGAGAVVCAWLLEEPTPELYSVSVVLGGAIGACLGYGLLALEKKKTQKVKRPTYSQDDIERGYTIRPFDERLSDYSDSPPDEENAAKQEFKSQMPYWTSITEFLRSQPRPISVIRQLLISLQKTIRGRDK